MKPTLHEQIRCVEREIRMRNHVYPGLVDRRKMSPHECEREMLAMAAVLETLKLCEQLAACLAEPPRIDLNLAKQIAAQLRGGGE